jgi:acyl-CoA thioester hydrolase
MTQKTKVPVYSLEIPVRWFDMDAYSHVNNSVYFTYFEQTRIDWWYKIRPIEFANHAEGHVVVNANCTFLKPINFPETIIVKLFVGPPGRSSYEFFYEIYSKQNPDVLYAEGSTKMVWIDLIKGTSIPLPEYILAYLPKKST